MTLAETMFYRFSLLQNVDFFFRIVLACVCGACIGVERSRRLKEAGIRTHIIVCCAAALMMIISKYGFADLSAADGTLLYGTRGADAARIAAQVVSGVSFLGAGVIFKNGSTIKGLTTAAGIWATAGIGLAMGAGLYVIGIFSTIVIALLQILMHKFVIGNDSMTTTHLQFTLQADDALEKNLEDYLLEHRAQVMKSVITYEEDHYITYDLVLKTPCEISVHEWHQFLAANGKIRSVSHSSIP